jgi:chemotaxis protein MotB
MAQGPDGKTIIIVKKVSGHAAHHGGSWKVAYADFVTSMMAFFMVLWLVNSAAIPVRERIASYFRAPGIFEKGSGTPIEMGGAGILPDTFAPPAVKDAQIQPSNRIYDILSDDGKQREVLGEGGGVSDGKQGKVEKDKFEKIAEEIKATLEKDAAKIEGLIGKIEVRVDQRGLHLEIMDTPKASMFARGSADIAPEAKDQLGKISALLQTLPNPLDIEGHTDATPFKGGRTGYDNWSLSTDRANSARKIFAGSGIKETQVARVVGYASQRPKLPEDPTAASNRRISISMRFTELAATTLKGTQAKETKAQPIGKVNSNTPTIPPVTPASTSGKTIGDKNPFVTK